MGEARPARRPRTHRAAAWGLTILTLAVLAADLVFVSLNASRIGTDKVGLNVILSAGVVRLLVVGGRRCRRWDGRAPW